MEICQRCHFKFRANGECFCTNKGVPSVISDFSEPVYNRGLGQWVKSKQEYRAILKEKGLEEVGNERKYVEPERGRQEAAKRLERSFASVKPDAMRILGEHGWN